MTRSECIPGVAVEWTGSMRFNARKLKRKSGVIVARPVQVAPGSNKYYCKVKTADGEEDILITRLKLDKRQAGVVL